MPVWYLILSAVVGFAVLAGVAYAEVNARRRRAAEPAFAGGLDGDVADAPMRREAETEFDRPAARRSARTTSTR